MSVLPYWKERLRQRQPIYSDALRVLRIAYKDRMSDQPGPQIVADTWPHSVARSCFHQDYLYWFEDIYLQPYKLTEYYVDNPDRMPTPVDELAFYTTMAPWLYIVGKGEQVRTYLIPTQEHIDGEWKKKKTHRYFVRLLPWEAHVAAFELQTGVLVDSPLLGYDKMNAHALEQARNDFMGTLIANRENMRRSMGVLDTA